MAKIKIHYKKGGPSQLPALRAALKASVDPQESLAEVIAELNALEQKYGLTTVQFFAQFKAGLMGDSRDFMHWAGLFEEYQHLINRRFNTKRAVAQPQTRRRKNSASIRA